MDSEKYVVVIDYNFADAREVYGFYRDKEAAYKAALADAMEELEESRDVYASTTIEVPGSHAFIALTNPSAVCESGVRMTFHIVSAADATAYGIEDEQLERIVAL